MTEEKNVFKVDLSTYTQPVKQRCFAVKKLNDDLKDLWRQFLIEKYQLLQKYHNIVTPILEKRKSVITGNHEPTTEELADLSDCPFLSGDNKSYESTSEDKLKPEIGKLFT
jgi:nucleosome assembly protein 1-like 1